jgi:ribosomal protein S18 acetylase RimI-like enzyme
MEMKPLQVRRLTDRDALYDILKTDRLYAAYAIGDLEPGLFEKCQWAAAYEGDEPVTLVLHFKGLLPNAVFCMGRADGLAAVLGSVMRPGRVFFAVKHEVMSTVRNFYQTDPAETLIRMHVTSDAFHPAPGEAVRLTNRDVGDLNELYRMGGGMGFAAFQVSMGRFYGMRVKGRLVATAGTHLVAPHYALACVGNVFTHPEHRGRGYAAACASAVVRDVLDEGCRDVVLNVRHDNTRAQSIYRRLGFLEHSRYAEAYATRKGSLVALLQRLFLG